MSPRRAPVRGDEGFTLLETMIALAVVGTVMAGLALFFVNSGTALRRQSDTQTAVQLAAGAMDYVSQLPGDNVLLGRTQQAVQAQWQAPGVPAYLDPARTELAWQDPATPASASVQGLPTTPERITVNGTATKFQRWWYVGLCWEPHGGGDCVVVPSQNRAQSVAMFRIVVAIIWPSPDCANSQCQYVGAMLAERSLDDPTWN